MRGSVHILVPKLIKKIGFDGQYCLTLYAPKVSSRSVHMVGCMGLMVIVTVTLCEHLH